MIINGSFDPQRDIQEVVPDLAVNIADCIENGVVFDTGTLAEYNDIDNPSNIWRRVRSAIDAAELHRTVSRNLAQSVSGSSVNSKPAAE